VNLYITLIWLESFIPHIFDLAGGILSALNLEEIGSLNTVDLVFFGMLTHITFTILTRRVPSAISTYLIMLFAFIPIIFYSLLLNGVHNLFGSSRLLLGAAIPIYFILKSRPRVFLELCLLTVFISGVDISYQFINRIENLDFVFGKNDLYLNHRIHIIAFPLAIYLLNRKESSEILRAYLFLYITLYVGVALLESSRSVLITIVLTLIIMCKGLVFRWPVIFLSLLIVSLALSNDQIANFFQKNLEGLSEVFSLKGTANIRLQAWTIVLDRVLERPMLGHGVNSGVGVINLSLLKVEGDRHLFIGGAHNVWLVLLGQIGFVGLTILVAPILFNVARLLRKIRLREDPDFKTASLAAISGLVGIVFEGATSPLGVTYGYVFWYAISLVALLLMNDDRKNELS
jgi:O-antigen ligase